MAGKALKDVNGLCKCPGCGATKRTHRLCANCLNGKAACATSCCIYLLFIDFRRIWKDDGTHGGHGMA